jgi:glycosyltransferase involved in cell wall biosynthesis
MDGKTGLLAPHQDVKALANALHILTNSPEIRQQMGKESREKFEQEFTVDRMITEIRAIYEEIIQK